MKLFRNLFTVPEGEKVTERHFKRVMISSVCGILLCMSCLLGTTWAWFQASIQAEFAPIEVANHQAVIYQNYEATTVNTLEVKMDAPKTVTVVFDTEADPKLDSFGDKDTFGYQPGRFIVMTVYIAADTQQAAEGDTSSEPVSTDPYPQFYGTYYIPAAYAPLSDGNDETNDPDAWHVTLELETGKNCKVVFSTAWNKPLEGVLAEPENGKLVLIAPTKTTDETEATSEPTGTTAATEATEATKATETTEATKATEATETTKATEATEAPTETTPATTEAKTE